MFLAEAMSRRGAGARGLGGGWWWIKMRWRQKCGVEWGEWGGDSRWATDIGGATLSGVCGGGVEWARGGERERNGINKMERDMSMGG